MKSTSFARFGILRRLARKELIEILRDRRTVLTLVLMPLLLYPLLGVAFRTFLFGNLTRPSAPIYRIGVRPGGEGRAVGWFLKQGLRAIQDRQTAETTAGNPPSHRRPTPDLQIMDSDDLESDALAERIQVGIRIRSAEPFDPIRFDRNLAAAW